MSNLKYNLLIICIILIATVSCKNDFNIEKRNHGISTYEKSIKLNDSVEIYNLFSIVGFNKLKLHQLSSEMRDYTLNGDSVRFRILSNFLNEKGKELKDTLILAEHARNMARFYNKYEIFDSAYYALKSASNFYGALDSQVVLSKIYYTMGTIKSKYYDNIGAENLIYKALKIEEKLGDDYSLFTSNQILGLIYTDNKEFSKAISSFRNAEKYSDNLSDNQSNSLNNNFGRLYQEKGNQDSAIYYFNLGLMEDSLSIKNPISFARLVDNKAYSYFLKRDTTGVHNQFQTAYGIRDSLNNKGGLIISNQHLAEYYQYAHQTARAKQYAENALNLSKEVKNGRDYLRSLELLSQIDTANSKSYLQQYISYNDSLYHANFETQNKFARIDYETEQYANKASQLQEEKKNAYLTMWLILGLVFLVIFTIYSQFKNYRIKAELDKQKADRELYLLTIQQQEKIEKEKLEERNRIAEELHDGILGKLFGSRLSLHYFKPKDDATKSIKFESLMDELQSIEQEIRDVSHTLSYQGVLPKYSFKELITQLIDKVCEGSDLQCSLDWDPDFDFENLKPEAQADIYKIVQESLRNIIKHADAENSILKIKNKGKNLELMIEDDGNGLLNIAKRKGIGIKNIKNRVRRLGGRFYTFSEPDKGSTILIKLPIKNISHGL